MCILEDRRISRENGLRLGHLTVETERGATLDSPKKLFEEGGTRRCVVVLQRRTRSVRTQKKASLAADLEVAPEVDCDAGQWHVVRAASFAHST